MGIEPEASCSFDYVNVYAGSLQNEAALLGSFCGTQVPTGGVVSTSSNLYVVFSSDDSIGGAGFTASFTIYTGADSGGSGSSNTGNTCTIFLHWYISLIDLWDTNSRLVFDLLINPIANSFVILSE